VNPRLSETRAPVRAREPDRQVCPVCVTRRHRRAGRLVRMPHAHAHRNTHAKRDKGIAAYQSISSTCNRPFLTARVKHTVFNKVVPAVVQRAFVSTPFVMLQLCGGQEPLSRCWNERCKLLSMVLNLDYTFFWHHRSNCLTVARKWCESSTFLLTVNNRFQEEKSVETGYTESLWLVAKLSMMPQKDCLVRPIFPYSIVPLGLNGILFLHFIISSTV